MKRIVLLLVLFSVALVAVAPIGAQAAGYETRSGGSNTSTTIFGVPVPGGGTQSSSTSSHDSFSRSRPVYNDWERANMTASTAVNVVGAMQSIAGLFGGMSAGPVIATPTGVYAPNGSGYGYDGGGGHDSRGNCVYGCGGGIGGYGYNGGQVPPFVYQRQVSAEPPAPRCYREPAGCLVPVSQGPDGRWQWQWVPATQPAPMPTVAVSVGQPVPAHRQCSDGRGFSWFC